MADTAAAPKAVEEKVAKLSPDASKAVVKWLTENCLTPGLKARENIYGFNNLPKYRRFFDGGPDGSGQWEDEQAPEDYAEFTANMVMPTVDTAKGIGLQTPPTPEFVPPSSDPDDVAFVDVLTGVIGEFLWYARGARKKLGEAWTDGAVVGTAIAKPYWNTRLYGGEGDIDFDILPVEDVVFDPAAREDNYGFVIQLSRRPVIEIRYDEEHYNDYRLDVKPDKAEAAEQKQDSVEKWIDLCTLKECWVRGFHLKALMDEVPGFKSEVDEEGLKYGMVISFVGDDVLAHKNHPWKSERLPFPKFLYYPGQGQAKTYGQGEVKFLIDSQVALNARITQVLHHAALIANKQKVISDYAVVNEAELNAKPGQLIHVNGPADAAIFELDPGHISPSLFNVISLIMRFFEIIPGMYEVNRGDNPGSVRAGVAIQALQRGGEGRTAQKSFSFDDFVVDIALVMADIMAVMYDDERVYRVTGLTEVPADAAPELEGEVIPEAAMPQMDPMTGAPMPPPLTPPRIETTREVKLDPAKFWRKDKTGADRRVQLDARSRTGMMFRSIEEMVQKLSEMMQAGIVDAEYVIEQAPLPGKEKLLQRLRGVQAQAAMPPAAEAAPAAALPPMEEQPAVASLPPEELSQMVQAIDGLMSQIQELEDEGLVPPGTIATLSKQLDAELNGGGDGTSTMQAAQSLLEGMMANEQQTGVA